MPRFMEHKKPYERKPVGPKPRGNPFSLEITHESYPGAKKEVTHKRITLEPGTYHIGRAEGYNLALKDEAGKVLHYLGKTDATVSRKHLKIEVTPEGRIKVTDVSTNGTLVRKGGMSSNQATTISEMKDEEHIGSNRKGFYLGVRDVPSLITMKPSMVTIKKIEKDLGI